MKRLWLDLETTGLDAEKNGIIQIAMIVEEDDEVIARYSSHVQPFPDDEVNEKALQINGVKREDMEGFPPPLQIGYEIIGFLHRHTSQTCKLRPCGYNVSFDLSFLEAFIRKNVLILTPIWRYLIRQTLDPLPVAVFLNEMGVTNQQNSKLSTMCKYYNINLPGAHDAVHDIEATRLLAYKMRDTITQIA